MGNISNAQLTAAVSNAGGLGTIGCGTLGADEVERIIQKGTYSRNELLSEVRDLMASYVRKTASARE